MNTGVIIVIFLVLVLFAILLYCLSRMRPLVHCKNFTLQTTCRHQFITITHMVQQVIAESGIRIGTVTIQSHHTTASIWVNEDEKNLIGPNEMLGYISDLSRVLDEFAPPGDNLYGHNDVRDAKNPEGKRDTHLCEADSCGVIPECINGHAHAQAMLLHTSVTMAVNSHKLVKGRWQEIMLVELDHDRQRTFTVLVQGLP